MHCPAILVSVKELLFSTYKNPLYVYVYVCVLLTSMKHFAVYIQEHLCPLLEVQMPLRFNTAAGKSSAPLRDSWGSSGARRGTPAHAAAARRAGPTLSLAAEAGSFGSPVLLGMVQQVLQPSCWKRPRTRGSPRKPRAGAWLRPRCRPGGTSPAHRSSPRQPSHCPASSPTQVIT